MLLHGRESSFFYLSILLSGALVLSAAQVALALDSSDLNDTDNAIIQSETDNLRIEANRLFRLGEQAFQDDQYTEALAFYQQALNRYIAMGEDGLSRQGESWFNMAVTSRILGAYVEAQTAAEQALQLANNHSNVILAGESLNELGVIAYSRSEFSQALQWYEQALELSQSLNNRSLEARVLDNMGVVYRRQGQLDTGLRLHQQAEVIWDKDPPNAASVLNLNNIGIAYDVLGNYDQAIEYNQRALELSHALDNRFLEARILSSLGVTYGNLSDYLQALELYQQALAINQNIGILAEAGRSLNNIGSIYLDLGQYEQARFYYQDALALRLQLGDRIGESATLSNLGTLAASEGNYGEAITFYEQALAISRAIGDQVGESLTLIGRGSVATSQGQYLQALEYYDMALVIQEQTQDIQGQGRSLSSLGGVYYLLGEWEIALEKYEQALSLQQNLGDRTGVSATLNNIGQIYAVQESWDQALDYYQASLSIREEVGDRVGVASTLSNIGILYSQLNRLDEAITIFETVLAIRREVGDRAGEAGVLHNIALLQNISGQPELSLSSYYQALSLFQTMGELGGMRLTLSNMGALMAHQGQNELAILFYKESVNLTEQIRRDLTDLPSNLQLSYVETVADSYRSLASLLLQENRVLEAQQVLDLLRVQELDDYLNGVRSSTQAENSIDLRDPEREIRNRVIAGGYELAQLRDIPPSQLSDDQIQRLAQLDADQQAMNADFLGFLDSPEIQSFVAELDASQRDQDILARAEEFVNLQNNLRAIDQNVVLIYPLILSDRLELVLVTAFGAPARYPVSAGSAELNAAIVEFRQALDDPRSDPRAIAQQLYTWLIAPMENDLEVIGAETILYAPDGVLRYIPLAALHDGDQWLIENYRINHITAASLQNFTLRPSATPLILAAAFSEGAFDVQIGQRSFSFAGLPFAGVEVENLVAAFPDTTQFMNDRFSRSLVEPLMDSHTIVHLATHAAFVPGSPADSFILFGNGDRLSLQDIRDTWQGRFNRVELIVLSACETGVGDALGNGEEILGFGYLMQEAGASAAIASLWAVSDGGTQTLMDAFYANLNQQMTKAEALRQAQIALITGDLTASGVERGASIDVISTRTGLPIAVAETLSHPYYWAPFILIGNGL